MEPAEPVALVLSGAASTLAVRPGELWNQVAAAVIAALREAQQ